MRIFISWSGEPAKHVASALRTFLDTVLAARVQPFMSEHDIAKGSRFGSVLGEELGATDTGLLVLTKQNQRAPWLVFEAGALSKSLVESRVIPLTLDLEHADLGSPLSQFQDAHLSDREGMWTVIDEVNRRLPDPLPERSLRILFHDSWAALQEVVAQALEDLAEPEAEPTRDAMLAEVLEGVRAISGQQQRIARRLTALENSTDPIRVAGSGSRDDPIRIAGLDALRRKMLEPVTDATRAFGAQVAANIRAANADGYERAQFEADQLEADLARLAADQERIERSRYDADEAARQRAEDAADEAARQRAEDAADEAARQRAEHAADEAARQRAEDAADEAAQQRGDEG